MILSSWCRGEWRLTWNASCTSVCTQPEFHEPATHFFFVPSHTLHFFCVSIAPRLCVCQRLCLDGCLGWQNAAASRGSQMRLSSFWQTGRWGGGCWTGPNPKKVLCDFLCCVGSTKGDNEFWDATLALVLTGIAVYSNYSGGTDHKVKFNMRTHSHTHTHVSRSHGNATFFFFSSWMLSQLQLHCGFIPLGFCLYLVVRSYKNIKVTSSLRDTRIFFLRVLLASAAQC